jgi:stearoyl-CoA desaturase (delta-9 desaturase)
MLVHGELRAPEEAKQRPGPGHPARFGPQLGRDSEPRFPRGLAAPASSSHAHLLAHLHIPPFPRSYVDSEYDPYSASKGFWYAHIGWMLVKQDKEKIGRVNITDLRADPLVAWQHKFYLPIALFMGFILPTIIAGLGWGDYYGGYFIAGVARLVFVHHSTFFVNSLAHWAGAADFADSHTARNSIITALLTLGEGYHNFHHEFPSDYRNGVKWWQYDPTKVTIWVMSVLGLTYDLISTPDDEIAKGELQMKQKALEREKMSPEWGPDPDSLPVMTWAAVQSGVASGRAWTVLREDPVQGSASKAPNRWFVLDVSDLLDEKNYAMVHPGGAGLLKGYLGADITTLFNHHTQENAAGYYRHSNAAHNMAMRLRVGILDRAPPAPKKD